MQYVWEKSYCDTSMRTTARMVKTVQVIELLMRRMRAGDMTDVGKHSSVVAINRENRLHDNFSYLVRDVNCVTLRIISSLLEQLRRTESDAASYRFVVRRRRSLFLDVDLISLGDLIQETIGNGGYGVFHDDVNLTFTKSGFLNGSDSPTLQKFN